MLSISHVFVDCQEDADLIVVSLCDVMDMWKLSGIKKTAKIPILAGGHYAFNYWSVSLLADYVWVGEIFGIIHLKTIEEIAESKHCYYSGKEAPLYSSTFIDWEMIPVCQIERNKAYYLGGVGCRNKCAFCFTSWTHAHQINTPDRIKSAHEIARKNKIHLMTVSNQYENDNASRTKDMLLADYLKRPVSGTLVRCGIEFATCENRKRFGKPLSNEDIFKAIQKTNTDNLTLKLFHITGYEPAEDYERYIDMLCRMFDRVHNNRLIQLEFTNLQYQNYTPLYDERWSINHENYIDIKTTKRWYDRLRAHSARILVGAPSPFNHVACRMGVELSKDKAQLDFWLKMIYRKDKYSKAEFYRALLDTGIFETDKRALNFRTGEILVIKGEGFNGETA